MTTFDTLADDYRQGRLGYANDIYNHLVGYGLSPSHKILDIGCGTGLASAPLVENGYNVTGVDPSQPMLDVAKEQLPSGTWINGRAESLPFKDGSFDVALSAQAMHHADLAQAISEVKRVLHPGGIVAIWWKGLLGDDPVRLLRDSVSRDLGIEPPPLTWRGSFREFYSAGFAHTQLRVVPWATVTTLKRFLAYERSRKIMHDTYGSHAGEYLARLEQRLRETFGEGDPLLPLGYMQYLYMAKI
jgi:ubiquinone/menaquinone biosynthesis C-methylase UbiE